MRKTQFLAATLVVLAATPALAVTMKTSAPTKPAVAAPQQASNVAAASNVSGDRFRPTNFLGAERAQVLQEGDAVMGLGNGLNGALGMGNNLEVGGGAGFNYNFNNNLADKHTVSLPLYGYGKMMLANDEAMSVALGARGNLTLKNTGDAMILGGGIFLPISLWKVGPGNLHLIPAISNVAIRPTYNFDSKFNLTGTVGYEMPLTNSWNLLLCDTINLNGNNSLTLGNRIALTPNLTADVGSVTLTGSDNLSINLINIGASFGTTAADMNKAWGY